ncbi:MAG: hypothetical protein UU81_C0003G0010 [Microgenomates group bacterium GW2011_GWC1_41_8]|uniref:Uncharacterized protein n=3 Tax=Candidatus Roizmaniibacteriota TaxID=1752723 RepID=A0A0G1A4D7_9BACT|nr:MAG: hypothetical protein UU14_C0015G0007 [Candidatus Roizmanbacteria bacterium GW2011_GWB1_40_7]KKR94711.1 MAG: hypothetical protein UU41_C0004G0011 [Candidatus Roizmanbacteria bacterium GW2011_GWA1_41_13]KKS20218.1 MAG: hypothetical protein UU78_C0066G0006 [Candidatus Roizmanbacteria bacterium GW2011_GWC2_41_7]KKS24694.1 MAG: hypothetical protein UU81_C0003G0010 [Microgenomates group bacterium GW2011_GWC1_41_8]OGK50024.1 MAG: hypothetical protein A3A55_03625 [Candidatus Roizmanbacteria bac
MDTKILVDNYIREGKDLISNLDQGKFPVNAALWFYDPDDGRWKLVIATPKYDEEGPLKVYSTIQNYLPHREENHLSLTDIAATSPNNKLISLLRKAITTKKDAISDIVFKENTIDNTFIESAYIYRIAPN